MSWNQPLCERCWINENSTWESISEGREILKDIRRPVRIKDAGIEQCCTCGEITISGIFVRKDPRLIPYPREENNHDE